MDKKELIEKMIADVMEHFDFDKVRKVMLYLDWKWDIGEGEMTVPSTYRLAKKAESLLRRVATSYDSEDESKPRVCSCGGFIAEMVNGTLSLTFTLEEMSACDEDYTDD